MSDPKAPGSVGRLPTAVANEMVRRLFADGGPESDDRILFPGVGHGELVEAVVRYCERHELDFPESVALETNEEFVEEAREKFGGLPLEVRRLNFLGNVPDLGEFEFIVSDPPVARLHDLSEEVREDLAMRFDTVSADGPGRDEDYYLAFFEQGLGMLAAEGRLVFATPDFTSKQGHSAIPELKRRLTTFHIEDIDESPVESPYGQAELDIVITTVAHAEPDSKYASEVDFEGVQEALTVTYDIGVADIMTQDPVAFHSDDDVHSVYLTLVRNDYDAAPVRDRGTGECLGLVSKAELTGADTGTLADGYITELDDSRLISATASFDELLTQLREKRFCVVGTADDIRGIVTRFDLNSMEVYFHLYAKFAQFEIGLRNAIRDYEIDWENALLEAGISWTDIKRRRKEYREKSEVAQDVLDTLLLSDLIKIVENSRLQAEIEFDRSSLGVRPSAINKLRGSVAHYQPLIHTMDSLSLPKQRTAENFGEIYDALNESLRALESRNYI